jgi:hypothetical protein
MAAWCIVLFRSRLFFILIFLTLILAFPPSLAPPNFVSDASNPGNYPLECFSRGKPSSTTTSEAGLLIQTAAEAYNPTIESIRAKGTSSASNSPVAFASTSNSKPLATQTSLYAIL